MKKLLAILLATIMLLTLTACGEKEEKGDKEKYTEYEDVVEALMEALEDGDEDKLAGLITGIFIKDHAEELAEDTIDDYEYTCDSYKVLGWKVNYVERDEDELEDLVDTLEDTFDDIKDMLEDGDIDKDDVEDLGFDLDFKPSKIKDYVSVEIIVDLGNDSTDVGIFEISVNIIKEGSGWRLTDVYIGSIEYIMYEMPAEG